jgi:hypothetical protein
MKNRNLSLATFLLLFAVRSIAQHAEHQAVSAHPSAFVDPQPLLSQALRLEEAMAFLGSALSSVDVQHLKQLKDEKPSAETVKHIEQILDPYCLSEIHINPEARVSIERGKAQAKLTQGAWKTFLVKVYNDAGVTAKLEIQSPNSLQPFNAWSFTPRVKEEDKLTPGQVADRFLTLAMYRNRPLLPNLSGLKLEYAVVQVYSKDAGQREAELSYNIGQGSQDIGFRNTIHVLFDISKSVKVNFHVKDDDGKPVMAAFQISDEISRFPGRTESIYPLQSRRVAAFDEYPDFYFQPQIYRQDGEHVMLAPGKYRVNYSRGPEYIPQTKDVTIPEGVESYDLSFQLKRWINMSKMGWQSADHHIHAAGCAHYDSPEEGVKPADMWRQTRGEDLNISALLAWGPSWYHQKTFFTGKDDPLSGNGKIMRNDVEVSGFPSSHAGHIVLLRVKEDDYPGTTEIEQWPSWTLPVLNWAKSQNAVVGYAHSGWGLEPVQRTDDLPNYVLPKMDGIGANEFVVTVTQNAVDFYSAGDTPAPWELNMYYHSLNCGFRTTLSGETDFPCITDARVGQARSYFKATGEVTYDGFVDAIRQGRSYVSDGKSHIMDFTVDGLEVGTKESLLKISGNKNIKISAKLVAYLPETQDSLGALIAKRPLTEKPYWDIERARTGISRKVPVELIVNGVPVDTAMIEADGKVKDVSFSYPISGSCWAALRVYPSSHSNPIFIEVSAKQINEKKSAEWCLAALEQCWKMKEVNIRPDERKAASEAYDKARNVYKLLISK